MLAGRPAGPQGLGFSCQKRYMAAADGCLQAMAARGRVRSEAEALKLGLHAQGGQGALGEPR